MFIFTWMLVIGWLGLFLASARHTSRSLPAPAEETPPYVLWMDTDGAIPALEPSPARVHRGPEMPTDDAFILKLSSQLAVPANLPARLAACSSQFVSVMPHPKGSLLGIARERLVRDLAGPINVNSVRHLSGYADERLVWFRAADAHRPGWGSNLSCIMARGRKFHSLDIDLRNGHIPGASGESVRTLRCLGTDEFESRLQDFTTAEPLLRPVVGVFLVIMNLGPWLGMLFPETRWTSLLAIGLGVATRLSTALRESFGWSLAVTAWACDAAFGLRWLTLKTESKVEPMPRLPHLPPPSLTSARHLEHFAWLENSALLWMARKLGGSSLVMEKIYENRPAGRNAFGRLIDRIALATDAARALRWRSLQVSKYLNQESAERVLSFPSGTARDVARCEVSHLVLVEPDADARRVASERLPAAIMVDGTIDEIPEGPFDAIVYIGLAEYLTELELLRHLAQLLERLPASGCLIISTTDEHPQKQFMSKMLGWDTRTRSVDTLIHALDTVGMRVEKKSSDPWGIQWVLCARPRLT